MPVPKTNHVCKCFLAILQRFANKAANAILEKYTNSIVEIVDARLKIVEEGIIHKIKNQDNAAAGAFELILEELKELNKHDK